MLHVLAWSIVLFFPFVIGNAVNQYKIGPIPGFYFTLSGLVHIGIFYFNALFLYPRFLNKSYWYIYVVSVVLLIYFSYFIKLQILVNGFPGAEIEARSHVLFPSVVAFIASVFYSIIVEKIRDEKLKKENEAMQLGMELKFLRSQINPHFLFNLLTNLVYLARKKSDNLEASLLMLSGLMRYMIYGNGKIAVQQEREYLENYIELQKLRFGRDVKIEFNMEVEEKTNYTIEPMLLIPFVENAFKHGTGYADNPFIDIELSLKNDVLTFRVANKFDEVPNSSKDETSGIGLNNVSSRLLLLYPKKHELIIDKTDHLYTINLTMMLT
jgi:LytS/YehU family sensor histidine kinase